MIDEVAGRLSKDALRLVCHALHASYEFSDSVHHTNERFECKRITVSAVYYLTISTLFVVLLSSADLILTHTFDLLSALDDPSQSPKNGLRPSDLR